MNDVLSLVLMFICGMILAILYLFGLWFTVQRIREGEHPVFWLITSLILRMALLLTAFYFILSYGNWEYLLAVLAGFITLRIFTTRSMRQRVSASTLAKEKRL